MNAEVAYACPYVPPELILACRLKPRRFASAKPADRLPPAEGMCPFAGAYCGSTLSEPPALAVFTTLCDQMRRGAERAGAKTFLLHVPRTGSEATLEFYRQELERLLGCLASISGHRPSGPELQAAISDCQARRETLQAQRKRLPYRSLWRALVTLRPPEAIAAGPPNCARRIPLALVGGPMMNEDVAFLDVLDNRGAFIALDATDTGELVLPARLDPSALQQDPLGELAAAYFAIPHPARRPNDAFYGCLLRQIRERHVRGVIFRRYLWCDTWHGEMEYLKGRLDVPLLDLEVGDFGRGEAHSAGRVEAFLEVLDGR